MVEKALSTLSPPIGSSKRWFEIVIASVLITLILGGVWLFASEWALIGVLASLVLAVTILYGYEYFPLALFVTLPFSVEVHLSEAT
ncbi:hypothetical protein K8I31_19000, partial [bacterium]|nr:hypothetical protein [bacterium]